MRTALQQAFARLEELHPSLFDIHTEKGRTFVNEFSKFLEVEREQICKFASDYVETQCNASFDGSVSVDITTEEYYNLTFKSEQL
jgi:hypothetical protein